MLESIVMASQMNTKHQELSQLILGEVHFDDLHQSIYATDISFYPKNIEETIV